MSAWRAKNLNHWNPEIVICITEYFMNITIIENAGFQSTYIVTKFKDTAAFENLQTKVCLEIAGVILARLKEIGVPDHRLQQVSDDICNDLLAAMHDIGNYKVPGEEVYAAVLKAKLKEMAAQKAKLKEMAALEEKLKEMAVLETRVKEMAVMEAKLKEMDALEARLDKLEQKQEEVKDQPLPSAYSVLSPDKVLGILNAAKIASS